MDVRQMPVAYFVQHDLEVKLLTCVFMLNELMQSGQTVYLHCSAGTGRSPTVAIAYLFWCCDWDLDRAITHVTQCRPCSPSIEVISLATARVGRVAPT